MNKRNEVREIRDYYEENSFNSRSEMNPIMFVFHLPHSIQNLGKTLPGHAKNEDFFCLYDGKLLFISGISPLDKQPWGVFDVRNEVIKIIETAVGEVDRIPPCLTFGGILYTKKAEILDNLAKFNCLVKESDETVYDNLYDFHLDANLEFEIFYDTSKITQNINKSIAEVKKYESDLLFDLKMFLASTWKHPFERGKIANQLKLTSANILEKLSEYSSFLIEHREASKKVKDERAKNEIFDNFLKEVSIEHFMEPDSLNVDSVMHIIEHAREENASYSSSISTTLSAVGGAVIGSILTIVFSYLLGFFQY
ncbi:MAG: hypothetical protein NWF00_00400 [Candidatus Bathyarchaeota archaeon]|nr:hypothetical protein [Candidatus Bathyarchaeota archaeon]